MDASSTIIVNPEVFQHLSNEFRILHKEDPTWEKIHPRDREEYKWWRPPKDIIDIVQGRAHMSRPWWRAKNVIIIVCTSGNHWITLNSNLKDWNIELFDSIIFQSIDAEDPEIRMKRARDLYPITRLLPRVIEASRYFFRENRDGAPITAPFSLVKDPAKQVVQVDEKSCGVFAMMYVDRLIHKAARVHEVDL